MGLMIPSSNLGQFTHSVLCFHITREVQISIHTYIYIHTHHCDTPSALGDRTSIDIQFYTIMNSRQLTAKITHVRRVTKETRPSP